MNPASLSLMPGKQRSFKRKKLSSSFSEVPQNSTSAISASLEAFRDKLTRNADDLSLNSIPEDVKNFFVPYFKLVQSIDDMFYCMNNLFANNTRFLKSRTLSDRLREIAEHSKCDLKKLTDDLIKEVSDKLKRNDAVFSLTDLDTVPESNKPSSTKSETSRVNKRPAEISDIEFSDSDIDLQLDEVVDQVCESELSSKKPSDKSNHCISTNLSVEGDKPAFRNLNFDSNGFLVVYVDGSCWSNGKANAKAGFGVWFNENHPLNFSAPVKGPPTNNNAEIQAATEAIRRAKKIGITKLLICTDSMFLINCMTQWISKWKRNNWKTSAKEDVKNKDSLLELDRALSLMQCVLWKHVEGHKGVLGNERADELAKRGANQYS